jgi:hypothetical protein
VLLAAITDLSSRAPFGIIITLIRPADRHKAFSGNRRLLLLSS